MRQSALFIAAFAAFAGLCGTISAAAQSTGLQITSPVDDHKRITLSGNTRPEARNPKNDSGAVSDKLRLDHILLQLKRPPQAEHMLDRLIDQLYDSHSANFHRWLTPAEFGYEFGPAGGDLRKVTNWLRSNGLTVNAIYASNMVVDFSGTAGQVSHAFDTPVHYLNLKGVRHIANIRDPQIPAALSSVVAGVVSLNDFRPRPLYRAKTKYIFRSGGNANEAMVPADLARIYNFNPLFSAGIAGKGQTIAVIEDSNLYSSADWTRFRSVFGLSSQSSGLLKTIHPNTRSSHENCRNPGVGADDGEATVDAEWASAGAPAATIEVASCSNTRTTFGGLIALQNLANSPNPPPVISISYGECEAWLGAAANAAYYSVYQQAAAEGISVFAAAGNEGAAGCDAGDWVSFRGIAVNGFASTPYNVAVGGTDFADSYLERNTIYWGSGKSGNYGSALSYIPEIPWNDSCASVLGALALNGSPITYGQGGFCNSNTGSGFWQMAAGSGGPSGCAFGASDLNRAAAVSGTCSGYAKPFWQSGLTGNPADGVRDLPDVSLFAGDGSWSHYYLFCWSDTGNGGASCSGTPYTWAAGGGTSFSAPVMAAIQALVDEKAGARQGNPDPEYYALAEKELGGSGNESCNSTLGNAASSRCVFYDVTLGDMDTHCTSAQDLGLEYANYSGAANCFMNGEFMGVLSTSNAKDDFAYGTGPGWDFATGIGTVNAANLVKAWPFLADGGPATP
ncbi:MAG TPA: protease pro-enzyme activation domain-containing protein [Rhizomicrobium sp.]